ncbi:MAG: hypothetical protein NDJ90_05220 [Oligoflexia bacterium]|nr:hypothetical protein [Oligoflexia bacterium]
MSLAPRTLSLVILFAAGLASQATYALPASCPEAFGQLARPIETIAAYKASHGTFRAITKQDNQAFKRLLKMRGDNSLTVLDAENAILKELNDHVFPEDKDLVTAFVNSFKDRLHTSVLADPELAPRIAARYQDHKSLRFIFEGNDPALQARIANAYEKASREFAESFRALGLDEKLRGARGLAAHPETWHLAGISSSLEEASAASRFARSFAGQNRIALQRFEDAKPALDTRLTHIEELRATLQASLGSSRLFRPVAAAPGKSVLTKEAVDAIRKVNVPDDATPEQLAAAVQRTLEGKFGVPVTAAQASSLRRYLSESDAFMAGLLVDERVVVPIGAAQHDVISVDFRGQNARNIEETLAALAVTSSRGGDSRVALAQSRFAEERATVKLDALKDRFRETVRELFGDSTPASTYFTGDDGSFLPSRTLTRTDHGLLAWFLQRNGEPSDMRLVRLARNRFTGATFAPEERMTRIVAAEKIEKKLRDVLSEKFSESAVSRLMFASELTPLERGRAGLRVTIIGNPPPALEAEARALIRKLAAEAKLDLHSIELMAPDRRPMWINTP